MTAGLTLSIMFVVNLADFLRKYTDQREILDKRNAEIASKIGAPKSVRAVAQACAANAIAVAIPCHRIVRSNGDMGGYRWGSERKKALLEMEREQAESHV